MPPSVPAPVPPGDELPDSPPASSDGLGHRPPAVVALVGLLALEAAAVGAGAVLGVGAVAGGERPAVAAFVVLFALGAAASLLASARSSWRGSSRSRGFVATWQLLQGATAVTLLQAGAVPAAAWAALAVAVAVLALVVTRPAPPAR